VEQREAATGRTFGLVLVIVLILVMRSAQPVHLETAARLLMDVLTIMLGFRAVTGADGRPSRPTE
jgi:hypothetical protein